MKEMSKMKEVDKMKEMREKEEKKITGIITEIAEILKPYSKELRQYGKSIFIYSIIIATTVFVIQLWILLGNKLGEGDNVVSKIHNLFSKLDSFDIIFIFVAVFNFIVFIIIARKNYNIWDKIFKNLEKK
jgi:ABC-type uncharacterized transport system fused permease/ATPase subunit